MEDLPTSQRAPTFREPICYSNCYPGKRVKKMQTRYLKVIAIILLGLMSGCGKIEQAHPSTTSPLPPALNSLTATLPQPTEAPPITATTASPSATTAPLKPPNDAVLSTPTNVNVLDAISVETVDQVKHLYTLSGHRDRVISLAFSGDGAYLASSSRDNTIKLWDIASGQEVHAFSMNEGDINGIAFSPDGRFLASADAIWDVENRQVVHTLERGRQVPGHVAFSPDGSFLAVQLVDQAIKLWDVTSGQEVRTFEEHAESAVFFSIEFSPDGALLAAGGRDGTVRLWDVASGKIAGTLAYGNESHVHDVDFSPDSSLLASGGTDYTVRLWDVASGQVVQTLRHRDGLYSVAFSPDGKILASAGVEHVVRLWDVENGRVLRTLPHDDELMAVAFSPDGMLLAAGGYDNQIYLWGVPPTVEQTPAAADDQVINIGTVSRLEKMTTFDMPDSFVNTIAFSPDSRTLITGDRNGEVLLWDRKTWQKTTCLPAQSNPAADQANQVWFWGTLGLSPNGSIIVTAYGDDGAITGRDREGQELFTFSYGERVYSVSFSPDGKVLAVGGLMNDVIIFDLETRQTVADLVADHEYITNLVFSPDGQTLLVSYERPENIMKTWDTATWLETATFTHVTDRIDYHDVLFTPDGKQLVIASTEAVEIKFWDLETQKVTQEFPEHTRAPYQIAFSPDGSLLASASDDGTLRFWDMETGVIVKTIRNGHETGAVAFSPDGTLIAFSVWGKGVQVWAVTP